MAAKDAAARGSSVGFRDGVLSPATLRSRQSTARRPSRLRRELLSIGLGGDGVGLGVSLLPSVGITTTVNLGDLLSSALPPYPPPISSASSSVPGSSLSSPTATIISETPDPTQPSTTSLTSASPTGQTANPDPGTTPSSSSQTATLEAPTASGTAAGNERSSTTSTFSGNGGIIASRTAAWHDLSSSTPGLMTISTVVYPPGSYPPAAPSGHIADPTPSPSHLPFPAHNASNPRGRLGTGAIVGIALAALTALACAALALCFLLPQRRARRRLGSKRMSVESARRRLEPYVYTYDPDDSSRPISSVWTLFGSVSVDPAFEPEPEPESEPGPRREPSTNSLDFQFAEKEGAYSASPGPSPCPSPSPALAETQPLARALSWSKLSSVHSLHGGLSPSPSPSHLDANANVPSPCPPSLRAASSSELLALAGTDYAVANPANTGSTEGGLGRSVSGVSRATAAAGEVQSVEAL